VNGTSDQTGPSKVVVFAEKEEMADTCYSSKLFELQGNSLDILATCDFQSWHSPFFASSGSQVKAVSPAVWTILEVSDSEYSVRIILTIDSLQSSFLTHDILCPQNIWTSDCLQFSFDTDIMCSVKSFPRVESAL